MVSLSLFSVSNFHGIFIKSRYIINSLDKEGTKTAPKTKNNLETSLQPIMEAQERIIVSAEPSRQRTLLRKEEAEKPLYLKRI